MMTQLSISNQSLALLAFFNLGVLVYPAIAKGCNVGKFGSRCQKLCHCSSSLPCDGNGLCKFGCESGWMGSTCSEKREKPTVTYQCRKTPNDGNNMYMIIHTKGISYRGIEALDKTKKPISWCIDTSPAPNYYGEAVATLKVKVSRRSLNALREGRCAGEEIRENVFRWYVAISEYGKLNLDGSIDVEVTCDFNAPETLIRGINVTTIRKDENEQFTKLSSTTENVELYLLNAVTRKRVTNVPIGTPVILKMSYGSPITGISPYNCYASSADQQHWKGLIDGNRCQDNESPVREFVNSQDPNAVETPWFPFFTMDGTPYTRISCSFTACYGDDYCDFSCKYRQHIKRRSVDQLKNLVVTALP